MKPQEYVQVKTPRTENETVIAVIHKGKIVATSVVDASEAAISVVAKHAFRSLIEKKK